MNINPTSSMQTNKETDENTNRKNELESLLSNRTRHIKSWLAGVSKADRAKYFHDFDFHPDSGRTINSSRLFKQTPNGLEPIPNPTITMADIDLSDELYSHKTSGDYKRIQDLKKDPDVHPLLKSEIIKDYKSVIGS